MSEAEEVQMGGDGVSRGPDTNALLDSLLSGDFDSGSNPTAQEQMAASGGVPLELQTGPTPEANPTPPAIVREARAVADTESGSEVDIAADLPDDILPESVRKPVEQPTIQQPIRTQQASEVDDIMPDEVKRSPKRAQDAWTAAKREAKQYKKELEELRKQAPTKQNTEEIDVLRKQLQETEERLGQIDITNSSTFKKQYESPINDLYRETVQELVKAGHDVEEAQQRVRALIHPDTNQESLSEQLSDLPTLLQGVLYTQTNKMKELQNRRMQAIKEWKNTRAAMQEEEQRQSEAIHQQLLVQNVDSAIDSLRQEGSFLYSRSASDDSWNKSVETRIQAAKGIMSGPPEVLAKYVADGVAAKTYRQLYLKERANAAKLKQDLDSVVAGRPIVGRDPSLGNAVPTAASRKPQNADSWLDTNLS